MVSTEIRANMYFLSLSSFSSVYSDSLHRSQISSLVEIRAPTSLVKVLRSSLLLCWRRRPTDISSSAVFSSRTWRMKASGSSPTLGAIAALGAAATALRFLAVLRLFAIAKVGMYVGVHSPFNTINAKIPFRWSGDNGI